MAPSNNHAAQTNNHLVGASKQRKSALAKELARSITCSWGRFLALMAIVALGCGFFAGLQMSGQVMRRAAHVWYAGTALYDVRIVCTSGITSAQKTELQNIQGVKNVMLAKTLDTLVRFDSKQVAARVTTMDFNEARAQGMSNATTVTSTRTNYLNRPQLVEGVWPTAHDECVIAQDAKRAGVDVGKTIQIVGQDSITGLFTFKTLKVVGKVRSSMYPYTGNFGTTNLGSGTIEQYLFVSEDALSSYLPYNEAYLTVDGSTNYLSGSSAYQDLIDETKNRLQEAFDNNAELKPATDVRILDRTQNEGIASYQADSERMDSIAQVFPLIFFLVAALVALTSMTRMVEDERIIIGVHKALGYSNAQIASKYLMYALIAAGLGAVLGILVLCQVLPQIIVSSYGTIYQVPVPQLPLALDISSSLRAGLLGVGVTLAATFVAVRASLKGAPAQLMVPRAPAAGKRILLERVRPLWQQLSFSWKICLRNLFRYKRRLFMTVVGIAGTSALLLVGFGLHNAIWDIIDKQFGEILHYNLVVGLEDGATAQQEEVLAATLADNSQVQKVYKADWVSVCVARANDAPQEGKSAQDTLITTVMVPRDVSNFKGALTLRDRLSQAALNLDDNAVIISEKLAAKQGVMVGDEVVFYAKDTSGKPTGNPYRLKVTGIMENYVNNYLIVGTNAWQKIEVEAAANSQTATDGTDNTEVQLTTSTLFLVDSTATGQNMQNLTRSLQDMDQVGVVEYLQDTIDTYLKTLEVVNLVVVVLIVSAAALAAIVVYNLTNINIEERVREIASLKVLGFTKKEVNAYIFREVILLALMGDVVGMFLGTWLASFVITTAEVDYVMFARGIHLASYALAFGLTLIFTWLVLLALKKKLNHINMVESLKSVD